MIFHPTHKRVRINQLICHLALVPAFFFGSLNWWLCALLFYYIFHGIGSACGAHRYFTHKSFEASAFSKWLMGICFTLASSGSVIGYVLVHRKHHMFSDSEKDPHDPSRTGRLLTWLGFLNKDNLRFEPKRYLELRKDPTLRILHDYYFAVILAYVAILFFIHPLAVIFAYAVPVVGQFHANSALIVLCHSKNWGYRNYETRDESRNLNILFRLFLLGEELHNNHHHRPSSVTMNTSGKLSEFDPLAPVIRWFLSRQKSMAYAKSE